MVKTTEAGSSDQTVRQILIVDDDRDFAESLADVVQAGGYRAVMAYSAEEALDALGASDVDVALVDVKLGDENGIDLIHSFQGIRPDVCSIVLTAFASTESVIQALHEHAHSYLQKPVSPLSLLSTLDRCFESIALRRQKQQAEKELARRNSDLETINRRLKRIVETVTKLTGSPTENDIDRQVLEAVAETLGVQGGTLFFVRGDFLELAHSLDSPHVPESIAIAELSGDSLLARTLQTKERTFVADVPNDESIRSSGWSGYRDGSALMFPLLAEDDELFGIMTLHNKNSPPFTTQDFDLGRIIIALITEVLRERRAKEAMKQSETRFRNLVEKGSDMITVIDADGVFRYESPSVQRVLGWIPGELVGTNVLAAVHPDDRKMTTREFVRGLATPGAVRQVEHRFRHKDGSYRILESYFRNLRDNPAINGIVINSRDVTARKDLEERLQILFTHAPDAVWLLDADGKFVDGNLAAEELVQAGKGEFVGQSLASCGLLREQGVARAAATLAKNLAGESTAPQEFTLNRRDGSEIIAEIHTHRVEMGGENYVLGIARDITRRRLAKQALRDSEVRYRTIVETTFDTLAISQDGEIKWINQHGLEMLGVDDPNDILGLPVIDLLAPAYRDTSAARVRGVQEEGVPADPMEIELTRRDGSTLFAEFRSIPIDFEGSPAVMHVGRDVHEQRIAEELLRESEAKYKTLFEAAGDGILLLDGDRFVDCNPEACRIFGLSRGEVVGRTPWELSPPTQSNGEASMERGLEQLRKAVSGQSVTFEWRHLHHDGPVVDTEVTLNRIELNDRPFVQAVVRDVSERKGQEAREREQNEQLFQAAKMVSLGTLVSGVAHEINNPNNLIRLSTENLAEFWLDIARILRTVDQTQEPVFLRGIDLDSAEEMISTMMKGLREGSVRIENLVKSLKEYARKDPGDLDQAVNLNAVVESAQMIIRNVIHKSTGHYSFDPAESLPSVTGNYHQIEQVVINLLTNACQALTGKQDAIRVSTASESDSSRVCVIVEDEGSGIPDDYMLHITDPFFTTKQDKGGTGLGLSVSQRIVQNHGGDLSFDSRIGAGTTVKLSLPAK